MYVIAFANPKGGTGKTTSALLLAEQLATTNARVGMLDCDPNQNLVSWQEQRRAAGRAMPCTVHPRPAEDEMVEMIDSLDDTYDFLIVDLEGTAAQIVTFALSRSDFCLIPFEPTPMETRQAARAVKLIESTGRMIRQTIPYALLMTRTNAAFQTSDERDVRAALENRPVLPASLVRRAAFTRIFRESLLLSELGEVGVSNLKPALENARAYARAVTDAIGNAEAAA